MDNEEKFECEFCGAEGEVEHNEEDTISFCPFCGEELYTGEAEDFYDENEEDYDE